MEKVLIVGTVSNVSRNLESEASRVYRALRRFKYISWFLVESDSSDNTSEILRKLKGKYVHFEYVELGDLKSIIPDRIERIRYCRNQYVNFIRAPLNGLVWDYVVIADLDGMNKKIDEKGVNSCFDGSPEWDACFANQKNGYYDLFALRVSGWMPNNCFDDFTTEIARIPIKFLRTTNSLQRLQRNLKLDNAKKISIYKKMRVIPRNNNWIKVDSAFGGFGIYRTEVFSEYNYDKYGTKLSQVSEHVDFHLKLNSTGKELYINPNLINSNWNTYNINRFFLIRHIRGLIRTMPKFRFFLRKLIGIKT